MNIALQHALEKINHAFALESITVHTESTSMSANGISGVIIKPGMYPVADEAKWNPQTLHLLVATPRIAHHLRSIGKADVTYMNGTVERARQMLEA